MTYFRSPNYPNTTTQADVEAACEFTATDSTFQASVFNSTSFLDDGSSDDYELDVIGVPVSGSSITRRLTAAGSTGGRPQRLNYTELVGVDLTRIAVTYAQGQRNLRFLLQFKGQQNLVRLRNLEKKNLYRKVEHILTKDDLHKMMTCIKHRP